MTAKVRYHIHRPMDGGGMGDIFIGSDIHLNREVVFKLLKDGEDQRRLIDEQKALMRLRSKHVVQIFDVISVTQGSVAKKAIVLEYIKGTTLKNGSYHKDTVFIKDIWQIACGLKDIHNSNIIHRDIKPNNIRIDRNGVVKIIDFGLARPNGDEAKTASIIGTIGYMAPELWGDGMIGFDKSIDVYAFGVMALRLLGIPLPLELTQQPPRPKNDLAIKNALHGLPSKIISIINQCMEYNPADRPDISSVEEILRKHLLAGKHRALLVSKNGTNELNAMHRIATVKYGSGCSISIEYNDFIFVVKHILGVVSINNIYAKVGDALPGCCVLTLHDSKKRMFVTFDISNPEVMP
ncbi:serine/threonine protein kinase [Aquitalea magnusonii]|uniref:Serine/threonine protein kinase n=1 Tax=Aquitalea magnusonii TaxID=332411 RepID=A0A3G9GL02_9NEIS|nr:serine/threonine-protein kinase [Aquitalea magnusonii]BBF87269.1 serine/threonine protein kinase [Aquitalea magnusonii]